MEIVRSVQVLKEKLLSLGEVDSSFSLAIIRGDLDAHTLLSVRQAEYLCDLTVVLALCELGEKSQKILIEAGVDVLFWPEDIPTSVRVETGVEDINATLILQTIITVMPMVVSVTQMDLQLLEVCIRLEKSFEGLFSLISKETPMEFLNVHQQNVRQMTMLLKDMVEGGEGDTDFFKSTLQKHADRYGYVVKELGIFDENLNLAEGSIPPLSGVVALCLERLGEKAFDTLGFGV